MKKSLPTITVKQMRAYARRHACAGQPTAYAYDVVAMTDACNLVGWNTPPAHVYQLSMPPAVIAAGYHEKTTLIELIELLDQLDEG